MNWGSGSDMVTTKTKAVVGRWVEKLDNLYRKDSKFVPKELEICIERIQQFVSKGAGENKTAKVALCGWKWTPSIGFNTNSTRFIRKQLSVLCDMKWSDSISDHPSLGLNHGSGNEHLVKSSIKAQMSRRVQRWSFPWIMTTPGNHWLLGTLPWTMSDDSLKEIFKRLNLNNRTRLECVCRRRGCIPRMVHKNEFFPSRLDTCYIPPRIRVPSGLHVFHAYLPLLSKWNFTSSGMLLWLGMVSYG